MASKIGTIFVELSLDDKVYKQRLGEVLTSSQATAKGVETSFKALGIKSSESFNQQRLAAQNAYTLIKNAATSTANDVIRAHDAMTAKIKTLDTQQFGHQETLIGKMKANWVGATVAITAAYAAMSGVTGFIKDIATAYGEQETAENRLRAALAAHGVTNKEVTAIYADYAAQLQSTTTYTDDAILSAMQLLTTMGTGPDKIKPATKAVLELSSAYGIDLNQAAKLVAQAMEGNYRGLTKLIPALKGVEAGGLDAAEVLDLIHQYTGDMAAKEAETYAGKIKMMSNSWGELKEMLGAGVVPAITSVIEAATAGIHALQGLFGATDTAWKRKEIELLGQQIKSLKEGSDLGTMGLGGLVDNTSRITELTERRDALEKSIAGTQKEQAKTLADAATKFVKAPMHTGDKEAAKAQQEALKAASDANRAYYEERIAQEDQWLRMSKLGQQDDLATTAQTIERKKTYLTDWYNTQARILGKQEKDEGVLAAKLSTLWLDYNKKWTAMSNDSELTIAQIRNKATDDAIAGMMEEIAAGEKLTMQSIKDAKDRDRALGKMYESIGGHAQDTYDLEVRLINEQAEEYRRLGIDEVDVAEWVARETEKAAEKKAIAEGDFFDGVRIALQNATTQYSDWTKAGIDLTNTFVESAETALSDVLFQAIKTGTVDAAAIWDTFCNAMLRKIVDTVAAMAVEVAARKVIAYFGTEWVAGGMNAISALAGIISGLGSEVANIVGEVGGMTDASGNVFDISDYGGSYAYGGLVRGNPRNGDSPANDIVRAMLSPGEYVVPRSIMQAIAGQGKQGDTILAHISPAEASLLKRLGGAGTVNEATGLLQFYKPSIVGGEADSNIYYDSQGNRYDVSGWNEGDKLGFGIGRGGWMLTAADRAVLGKHPTRQQIIDYYTDRYNQLTVYGSMPNASAMTAEDIAYQNHYGSRYVLEQFGAGAQPYYDETASLPYPKEVMDAILMFRQTRERPGVQGGVNTWSGQVLTPAVMALLSYGFGTAGGAVLGGAIGTTAGTAVGAAFPSSLMTGLQGDWKGALYNILLSWATSAIGGYVKDYVSGVTDSAIASYAAGKLTGMGIKYGLNSAFKAAGMGSSPVKVSFAGMSGAQELGNILADFSSRIAPTSEGVGIPLASGISYVPYDNYPARLHKGERVVPANENRNGGNVFHIYLDGEEIKGRMRIIADKVFVDRASSGIGSMQRVYS
jgi:hypothetical protein